MSAVRIWEDQEVQAQDLETTATTIIEDDVEPLPDDSRNLRPLSTNLMGVHFDIFKQDEVDEENSEEHSEENSEESGGDDNKVRDLIVGDLLGGEKSNDPEDMSVQDLLGDVTMPPNVEPRLEFYSASHLSNISNTGT